MNSFFDRRLLLNVLLTLGSSLVLLYIIEAADVIHWPYLYAAVSAAIIGFVEPRKGWLLAIFQTVIIWVGYTFFTDAPQKGGERELEQFSLYGSIALTFIGSFVGGILKRALVS